jgi:thymidylate synthase
MRQNPAVKNSYDFEYAHFALTGYNPHPGIKAPIAV